jgi:hypothetical protein
MRRLDLNYPMNCLHRAKLLTKQVERQTGTPLVNEEHVEDRKLNDSLIRAGADSVQCAREVPLSGTVEFSLPNHGSENEKSRDQEYWSATDLHRHWDPEQVSKALLKVNTDVRCDLSGNVMG